MLEVSTARLDHLCELINLLLQQFELELESQVLSLAIQKILLHGKSAFSKLSPVSLGDPERVFGA